ncbi:MAG: hypothetical protein R2734_07660 [Nocardioides sp.]
MRDGLGMSAVVAGVSTALPPCASGWSGLAVALARRVRTTAGVRLGLLTAAAGPAAPQHHRLPARSLPLTVVALGGMALGTSWYRPG